MITFSGEARGDVNKFTENCYAISEGKLYRFLAEAGEVGKLVDKLVKIGEVEKHTYSHSGRGELTETKVEHHCDWIVIFR